MSQPLFLGDSEEGEQGLQTAPLRGGAPTTLYPSLKPRLGLEREETRFTGPYTEHA